MKQLPFEVPEGQFAILKPAKQTAIEREKNVGWVWCYRSDRHLYEVTFEKGFRCYLRDGRRCRRQKGHDLVVGHYDLPTGLVPKDITVGNDPQPWLDKIAGIRGASPRILFALDGETGPSKLIVHCITVETFECKGQSDLEAMNFVSLNAEADPRLAYLADCFREQDGSWRGPIRGAKKR